MTANETAKSTIYYDCFNGNNVPYYTGSADSLDSIASCEVSLTMATTGTGVTNSGGVFDVWWVHGGASRICVATNGSGGGWASDTGGSNTARGTGYSQVHNTRGYWTNVNAIADCYNGSTNYGSISADQATYLGTIYTTSAGQTGVNFQPAAASGGAAPIVGLWNAYNQVPLRVRNIDNASGWTVSTTSWVTSDSSSSNRVSWVDGLGQDTIGVIDSEFAKAMNMTSVPGIGVVEDSTTATPTVSSIQYLSDTAATVGTTLSASNTFLPLIGFHYAQMMETNDDVSGSATFGGAFNGSNTVYIVVEGTF